MILLLLFSYRRVRYVAAKQRSEVRSCDSMEAHLARNRLTSDRTTLSPFGILVILCTRGTGDCRGVGVGVTSHAHFAQTLYQARGICIYTCSIIILWLVFTLLTRKRIINVPTTLHHVFATRRSRPRVILYDCLRLRPSIERTRVRTINVIKYTRTRFHVKNDWIYYACACNNNASLRL